MSKQSLKFRILVAHFLLLILVIRYCMALPFMINIFQMCMGCVLPPNSIGVSLEFMNVHLKAISLPIDHDIFFMCLLKNEKVYLPLYCEFTFACNTILLALKLVVEQKIKMLSSTIFCYLHIFCVCMNLTHDKPYQKPKMYSI